MAWKRHIELIYQFFLSDSIIYVLITLIKFKSNLLNWFSLLRIWWYILSRTCWTLALLWLETRLASTCVRHRIGMVSKSFLEIFYQFGPLWTILDHFDHLSSFWAIWDHFEHFLGLKKNISFSSFRFLFRLCLDFFC